MKDTIRRLFGRTSSEERANVGDLVDDLPRGKGASAAQGRNDRGRAQLEAKIIDETQRRDFLRAGLLGAAGVGTLGFLLSRRAGGDLGDGIGGTHIDPNDIVSKRIAGVRIATEFDSAKHAGTSGDPYTLAAIQAAAADGSPVMLPAVYFADDTPAALVAGTKLVGAGRQRTFLTPTGAAVSALDVSGISNWTIRDLSIIAPSAGGGIKGTGTMVDALIENVDISNVPSTFYGVDLAEIYRLRIAHLVSVGAGGGVRLLNDSSTSNAGDSLLEDVQVSLTGTTGSDSGFYISGKQAAGGRVMNDIDILFPYVAATGSHNNTKRGITLRNADRIRLKHPNIQGPDIGIDIDGGAGGGVVCTSNEVDGTYFNNINANNEILIGTQAYDTMVRRPYWNTGLTDISYQANLWKVTKYDDDGMGYRTPVLRQFTIGEFFDDFLGAAVMGWWATVAGTPSIDTSRSGGWVSLLTGASSLDECRIDFGGSMFCKRNGGFFFQTQVSKVSAGPSQDVRFGLYNGTIGSTGHGAYFEALAADANWFAVTNNGAGQTRATTGITYSGTAHTFGLRTNATGSIIDFFIDGLSVASLTLTLPGSTTMIAPFFSIVAQGVGGKSMLVDYCRILTSRLGSQA